MTTYDQWKTRSPDDDAPEVDNPLNYRNLGMRAVSPMHSVGLDCHHCRVTWGGCAAECCCPVCGSPKDYTREGQCMCERCEPGQVNDTLQAIVPDDTLSF